MIHWDAPGLLNQVSEMGGTRMHHEKDPKVVPIEGREEFVRDNAMALLADRDGKIERQQFRIRQLEAAIASQRQTIKQLQDSCPYRQAVERILAVTEWPDSQQEELTPEEIIGRIASTALALGERP